MATIGIRSRLLVLAAALAVFFALALAASPARADAGDYFLDVNRQQNVVTVYARDGAGNYTVPVKAMVCATGRNNGTPAGTYTLTQKLNWHTLLHNGGYVYGQYCVRLNNTSYLFHSVYYWRYGDKGSISEERYNRLGTQASDGCINLCVRDAKWIFDCCPSGTPVHIFDAQELPVEMPTAPLLDPQDPRSGWDPTDPDPENPWLNG